MAINGGFDWFMKPERESFLNQWNGIYMGNPQQGLPALRPGIVFENTTIGALSTDGDFVYTIEDLVEPPPSIYAQQQMMGFVGNPNINNWPQDIIKAVGHSRLRAFDLTHGCATAWSLPAEGDDKSEFADSYFLGPPLCLNGKLYVLTEKQQELRLVCLENVKHGAGWTTKVDFMLSLGTARDSQMQQDPLRRIHAAHLSYGDGVLVCPTNLGYVIGIDLLQNSLLWAYPYRDKTDVAEEPAGGTVMGPGGMPMRIRGGWVPSGTYNQSPPQSGWKVSAPIIQDGKVVFTATDSKSIHCVRLKDGTPVWSRPRQENDLFLGGVVNGKVIIVGTKTVHAYTLAKGDDAWTVETGLPSGFGAASDNTYYLPLQKSIARKGAGNLRHRRGPRHYHRRNKARAVKDGVPPEAPGNLVFFDGKIVSQTMDKVTAYPQLQLKIASMTEALKANPNDSQGLFDRGELSLEAGNLEGAVQDFRQVLAHNPPAALVGNVRGKLYDALTEDFQYHFDQAEKYEDDYAALCSLDLPADATTAQARSRPADGEPTSFTLSPRARKASAN